ncbi:Cytosolic Arginine Sensor For Mtorc1 Subunit 1 [Manis pentadactyla]|nr:Cytosolic Arginine Sensor For Mtorc1 Subunit 1 [Manis pentadactyla]
MELHILEHRVRVLSLARPGLWLYTHPLIKLLFLPRRSRCKFFSLTETPEDYTLMVDEEGFKELPPSEFLQVAEATWLVLNVSSHSGATVQAAGVTKIARSVIAPLAEHHVSVLMLSTYQTDFILVREQDLSVVIHTLAQEFDIYREVGGEPVPVARDDSSNGFPRAQHGPSPTVHPIQSPQNRFCVLTLDPETLPAIATTLIDVLFYSYSAPKEAASGSPGPSCITFFAFSLIEGYISIVMDAETQKKFPSDLLLTSSSGELWRMVRIGGQPLGFDECGIVAQIAGPLAAADISAYYISTFNFDHALVPEDGISSVIEKGKKGVTSAYSEVSVAPQKSQNEGQASGSAPDLSLGTRAADQRSREHSPAWNETGKKSSLPRPLCQVISSRRSYNRSSPSGRPCLRVETGEVSLAVPVTF